VNPTGAVMKQEIARARPEVEKVFEPTTETALSVVVQTTPEASLAALPLGDTPKRASLGRIMRRFRGDADAIRERDGAGADVDQELTLMLLREENARLKADRHRPADVGGTIDRLRLVAAEQTDPEVLDDVWGLLAECLTIREGLDHACDEVHAAISAVQERLTQLKVKIQDTAVIQESSVIVDSAVLVESSSIVVDEPLPTLNKAVLALYARGAA